MKSPLIFSVILLALLALLQYKLWFSEEGVSEFWHLKKNLAELNEKNLHLQERNSHVAVEVAGLKQGKEVVEEHARNDLGMVKSNETFYQLVE